ncbi:beta strand repeat-containing protein, partial [Janthinobacterium lividum]
MRLAGTLLFVLLSLLSSQASAASTCPSPRAVSIVAGGEYYEDYTNAPCSQFGLTGTLVAPLYGTLEDSNATNAVRYRNTNLSATSDTFTVRDDVGQPIVYNVTITSAIVLAPATVPNATVAQPYSTTTVTATGGAAPYTYAISAGALPAGMSLSGGGVLSGTPTAGGTFNFTVRATDSLAVNGTRAYTLTVSAPTIAILPTTLPAMTAGLAYSQTIAASGGTGTYTYARTAGSLPAGLTLASNGTLSGTPTAAGAYSFTVTATDSSTGAGPYSGARAYSGTVAAGAPVAGNVSATVAYGSSANPVTLDLSGGVATSVAVASAALHGTATANGTSITYTPTAGYAGLDSFTYTASNGIGTSAAATVAVIVNALEVTLVPTVPGATIAMAYSQNLSAANGTAPYTYAITSGALPAGISLNTSTGLLSGTPTASGTFNFAARATDSSPGSGPFSTTQGYLLTVAAPTIAIAPATLSAMTAGVAGSQTITASGGTSTYTYTISAGTLPAGVSLNTATGLLSGTPTAVGTFNFTVLATDSSTGSGPYTGTRAYSLTVAVPAISVAPAALPAMTAGVAFNQGVSATGGTAAYSYAVTAGSLPMGLSLAANGTLSGTPTVAGAYSFSITATDSSSGSGPYTGVRAYTGTVAVAVPVAGAVTTTVAYGSSANPITLNLGGGAAASVAVASPPAHGTATASGTSISYTPTTGYGGSDSFTYTATNGSGTSAPATVMVTVGAPAVSLIPATLPNPVAESPYSVSVTATGGMAPYTYSVTSGSLPAGLTLNASTGVLSGTTNVAGSFPFSIKVTDSSTGAGAPFSATNSYTLSVGAPTITVTPATLPAATAATAYSRQLTANGGVAPYAYTVSSGSLPAGLTLSGSGLLSGTPTAAGSFTLTVQAEDAHQFTGTQSYTLTVASASVSLTPASLPNPTAEAAYSATLTATGGTAPYTFSVSSGNLPTGLNLNASTGVLSGTTNVAGSFPFSIKVTDSSTGVGAPFSATNSYTLAVAAPTLTLTPASLAAIRAGDAYSQAFTAGG